jgi:methylthioxylose transferase
MKSWRSYLLPVGVVAAAVAAVWWSVIKGRAEQRVNTRLNLGAAPLVGRDELDGWVWRFGWSLVGAGVVALLIVVLCRVGWWWRVRQRWVLCTTAIGAMAFSTLLALSDGTEGLRYGAEHKTEYLANVATAPPAGEFVRTFVDRIGDYSVHVRGHPPGFLVFLQFLDAIGLGGVWPVVIVSILGTGATAAAVLLAVRSMPPTRCGCRPLVTRCSLRSARWASRRWRKASSGRACRRCGWAL